MTQLFFLYVLLNLTRIVGLRKENLVKHIRKRAIQTGRLFSSCSLTIRFEVIQKFILYNSSPKQIQNKIHKFVTYSII